MGNNKQYTSTQHASSTSDPHFMFYIKKKLVGQVDVLGLGLGLDV